MDLAQLRQLFNRGAGANAGGPAADTPQPDTAEKVQISSLSLLKMLKHGNFSQLCFLPSASFPFILLSTFSIFPLYFSILSLEN